MIKVLFICHGNICRSPMAEMVFKDLVRKENLESEFYINSAATSREELGSSIHPGTRRKLAQVGVPCGEHRATLVTKSDYDKYDYLIIMDERNRRNLSYIIPNDPKQKISLLLDYAGRPGEPIADPWYTGNFDVTYEDVVAGCTGLLNEIKAIKGY